MLRSIRSSAWLRASRWPAASPALNSAVQMCRGFMRPLSTEAAPVATALPEPIASRQAWLTSLDGSKLGLVSLNNHIFGAAYRPDILHRVVVWQLARRRSGLAKVKGRAEIRGSTRKISPQKGQGRARHGAKSAPIFVGGGRVHGPHPRSYDYTLPKKIRKLGLRVALSVKYAQGHLSVVDQVVVPSHKTKYLHQMLLKRGLGERCSGLVVGSEELSADLKLAALNIPYANVMSCRGVNVYDVLTYKKVVLSLDAVRYLERLLM